jgi:YD repeat-containing protein
VFYPFGVNSLFEPPEIAFGEPSAAPSQLAHELVHTVQQRKAMEMRSRVNLFSGEALWMEADLQIKGRGMDFIWARKHRSRTGPNTAQGNRWDFSYNIFIQRVGAHVKVFDGSGRADIFLAQADGSYVANEFFREGRFDSNNVFTLMFADTGIWEFRPLTAESAPGKISRIVDRNGNALTFSYDVLDRLSRITDTLGRGISVAYNADGFIESVTDFIGRQVRYAYYQDADPGGSFGDLKSVTSPIVTNTPTGNDFPLGKMTTYTYTEGFADDRANHMLRAVASPDVNITHDHSYQHSQSDLDFLRVTARRVGNAGEVVRYTYVPQTPSSSNGQAVVKTIVNDRVGNVSERSYDARNRLVLLREFTGRAVPGQPTTETVNRPMNPLRTNDPPFFETRFEWNVDSLPARIVFPNGNSVSNTYELALNPAASRRSRANLRVVHVLPGPLGGDQTELLRTFEHDPRFGTEGHSYEDFYEKFAVLGENGSGNEVQSGLTFVTRHMDGRSNETFYAYDERGNCTNIIHRVPSIVEDFEYNQFGQLIAYVAPDNGSGHRSRFNGQYYTTGAQHSYLHQVIADAVAGGLNLTTTYEYDAVGNVTRVIDPRGNDSLFTYNALDQLVRSQSPLSGSPAIRYTRDFFYDAKDNLVRVDLENRDENGTLVSSNTHFTVTMDYDVLNCRTQVGEEISSSKMLTTQFSYDANRNLAGVRFPEAVNSNQPQNTVAFAYDERDLLFQKTRAPGSPDASTTFVDYDRNANCKRVSKIEAIVIKQQLFDYDGFNRLTAMIDAMGNVARWRYDPNGNVTDFGVEGELEDVTGGLSNTILFAEKYAYDGMDRLISMDASHFDPATQMPIGDGHSISLFTYAGTSQLLTVTDDNDHITRYTYDQVNRLASVVDPKTNAVTYTYDAVGNRIAVTSLERSDLGNPPQVFTTRYTYDALNRPTRVMDNVSNVVQYAYDSRNNPVLATDPLGLTTRHEYDGLNRQVIWVKDMNTNGASPTDKNDIIVRQVWDDSSRLVQQIDNNGNITRYSYDGLNRLVRTALADGTVVSNMFDVFDNVVMTRDANSNIVNYAYDLLNRVTNKMILPGPGVSSNTTFERFAYDGLSRLVRAQNDGSTAEFQYDSLGNMARQLTSGKTNTATFDGVGNLLSCVYPGGRALQFTYDANDNRTEVDEGGLNQFMHKLIGHRFERRNSGNRTRTDYTYDGITGVPNPAGDFGVKQLVRTTHSLSGLGTIIDDRSYRWDARYSKTSRNDLRSAGPLNLHQYSYDAADRLIHTMVTQPSTGVLRDTRYVLDGVGNRTSVTNNGVGEVYTRSATTPVPADFQVNQYTATGADTRQYDENGNLTRVNPGRREERQLEFDYADRLVRVVDLVAQRTNQFAYDALGRRIRKTVSASGMSTQVQRYSYWFEGSPSSSGWQLIEEQNSAGAVLASYLYDGFGGLVQMRRGSNDYFYHCDDQGNVMALTDELGNVAERYDYGDFGVPQFFNAGGTPIPESAVGNPYLFAGLRYDSEVGYYCNTSTGAVPYEKQPVARYYLENAWPSFDPAAGRFLGRKQADGLGNALTFAANNPWSLSQRYTMFLAAGTPLRISSWEHQYDYRPGKWAQADYNFESPVQHPRSGGGGAWPKVDGLDVSWEVPEYQPSERWILPGNTKYTSVKLPRAGGARHRMFSPVDRTHLPAPGSFYGPGVYKSTDQGKTWSYKNPNSFQIISAGRGGAYDHPDLYRNIWINQGEIPAAPSNQGWGKWEVSIGRVLDGVSVYFNPKELAIDKPVPWQRSSAPPGGSMILPRVGWEVNQSARPAVLLQRLANPQSQSAQKRWFSSSFAFRLDGLHSGANYSGTHVLYQDVFIP